MPRIVNSGFNSLFLWSRYNAFHDLLIPDNDSCAGVQRMIPWNPIKLDLVSQPETARLELWLCHCLHVKPWQFKRASIRYWMICKTSELEIDHLDRYPRMSEAPICLWQNYLLMHEWHGDTCRKIWIRARIHGSCTNYCLMTAIENMIRFVRCLKIAWSNHQARSRDWLVTAAKLDYGCGFFSEMCYLLYSHSCDNH
jgi:hypothetical protein